MAHQKRISAPKHYPVDRKSEKYVSKGEGPYQEKDSIPVSVLLRDVLGFADTTAEAKKIIQDQKLEINGRNVNGVNRTVGFMDIVSIAEVNKDYRVVLDQKGLVFKEVDDGDKRLFKIDDKKTLKGQRTQLNLEGGENRIVEDGDEYSTLSTIVVDLGDGSIEKEIPFEEGNLAFITGGQHTGQLAVVEDKIVTSGSQDNKILLDHDGEEFQTVQDYVFIVGEDEPEVEL